MFVNLKNIIEFCKIKKERIKHIIKFHEINFNLMIMRKILLPYAKDESGSLVSIKDASRSGKYTCPECGGELSLRKSKIPQGEKYHKRDHFAHKGGVERGCSESFLHRLFKEKCVEYIKNKIKENSEFYFEWQCEQCKEHHRENLLKKACEVKSEYALNGCKPDIALLDKDGNVVIVVEVVVTHKPEPNVLQYYDANKIACLQINLEDFSDCDRLEEKLGRPNSVNLCPTPICERCGKHMQQATLQLIRDHCWKCGEEMFITMLVPNNEELFISADQFFEDEIRLANENGANIKFKYSKTIGTSYYANTCKKCDAISGLFYQHEYEYAWPEKEIDAGYRCFKCRERVEDDF